MIRVLIADDHAVVRDGLEQLLATADDMEIAGIASGGQEAVELTVATAPNVVLMDILMPDIDGIRATRQVRRRAPDVQVVMLTVCTDVRHVVEALDAGAIGYLLKEDAPETVLRGIRAAAEGGSPLAPKAARHVLASRRPPSTGRSLTDREREILAMLAEGRTNKVIGLQLEISEKTVKHHVGRIYQAIGVASRADAASWARAHGIRRSG